MQSQTQSGTSTLFRCEDPGQVSSAVPDHLLYVDNLDSTSNLQSTDKKEIQIYSTFIQRLQLLYLYKSILQILWN